MVSFSRKGAKGAKDFIPPRVDADFAGFSRSDDFVRG
jgi:hypothetical protein